MEYDLLKKLGMTDGEIKVYQALLHLGQSSTGNIMKKSGISSSKIYLIIDKLVQKGLVSYTVDNNVKHFQITDPRMILEFVDEQREELDVARQRLEALIPAMQNILGSSYEGTAQVYRGSKGVYLAFTTLLEEFDENEACLCSALSSEELEDTTALRLIKSFHNNAAQKKMLCQVHGQSNVEKQYASMPITFHPTKHLLPTGIIVGKNQVLLLSFGTDPTAYALYSPDMVRKYTTLLCQCQP